jgi:hypothetical protein
MSGHETFACYAFPPNELGYCGPADVAQAELGTHAREFDGAWPYLEAIADAADVSDPLDEEVVRTYWVGGPLLDKVDPADLLSRLRRTFASQVTGLLRDLPEGTNPLAHHSFHVFAVYPWVRFLDRDPTTPLRVMQDCRIRSGTVESVDDEHAEITSRRLTYADGKLALGDPRVERVRWSRGGDSLVPAPVPGATVAAHWDWVCGALSDDDAECLDEATRATLDLVNAARSVSG